MLQNTARRAPHQGPTQPFAHHAPNAALLIDFDNVTMGIRSDLGKELKSLLGSEVIRGKVAVQRAYADWRRYPQYIVPLAESSIDLIFAPAYGSSKKNATDLRMAIDAMELVFTRPEIGTFILMTGDSDFSSCVLKLKEYGKYVIGVGMRESSSDLLIQNCDEYYSYHALSGLTRADEVVESKEDPWVLLKRAAQQMAARGDVMRTDRLKQVMLEIDPAFDEKAVGYSKFSRFVQEASSKGLLKLRKSENGQYEIVLDEAEESAAERPARREAAESDGRRSRRGGRGRDRDRDRGREEAAEPAASVEAPREIAAAEPAAAAPAAEPAATPAAPAPRAEAAPERDDAAAAGPVQDIEQAYGLLQMAVRELGGGKGGVRDGDVKRKMMELSPGFDEGALGFAKFTRFLRQAHDAEAIDLNRVNGGNYEVSPPTSGKRFAAPATAAPGTARAPVATPATPEAAPAAEAKPSSRRGGRSAPKQEPSAEPKATASEERTEAAPPAEPARTEAQRPAASAASAPGAPAAPRPGVGALRRRGGRPTAGEGPPPLLPGQVVAPPGAASAPAAAPTAQPAVAQADGAPATDEEAKKPARRSRRGRGKPKAEGVDEAKASKAPAAKAPKAQKAEAAPAEEKAPAKRGRTRKSPAKEAAPAAPSFSAEALELPRDRDSVAAYLTNSYKGIGQKTADSLLDSFGDDVFRVMQEEPDRVRSLLGARAKGLLEQWSDDYGRRTDGAGPAAQSAAPAAAEDEKPRSRSRRGGRGGKGRSKREPSKA